MFIEENGISSHESDGLDGVDWLLGRDHVAIAEQC